MPAAAPRATALTSCEAYRDLAPTLAERERAVRLGLERFYQARRCWPTSYELFEFMREWGTGHVKDLNDVRPRLTEMSQRLRPLVFKGAKRTCSVTGRTSLTWELPPLKLF